jgi:hypothetical protein
VMDWISICRESTLRRLGTITTRSARNVSAVGDALGPLIRSPSTSTRDQPTRMSEGLHHLALQKTPTATRKPMMPLAIRTTRAARAISAHLLPLPAAIRDVLPAMQIG